MRVWTFDSSDGHTGWLRRLLVLGTAVLSVGLLNLAGCPQPTYHQMFPDVTLKSVVTITADSSLSNDAKTTALKALGITDEQTLFLLINARLPASASQPSS